MNTRSLFASIDCPFSWKQGRVKGFSRFDINKPVFCNQVIGVDNGKNEREFITVKRGIEEN